MICMPCFDVVCLPCAADVGSVEVVCSPEASAELLTSAVASASASVTSNRPTSKRSAETRLLDLQQQTLDAVNRVADIQQQLLDVKKAELDLQREMVTMKKAKLFSLGWVQDEQGNWAILFPKTGEE